MGHTAGRLIGREAPLAQLGDAVARARDGVSTTVLIEADAGIGKSRLVADGLRTFRDPKDAVAVGYGVELAGGAIPYGTVTETLRTLVRDVGVDRVRTAAGSSRRCACTLSPDLGLDDNGSGVDRSRVLPAYVTTFENLASDRLVWLVIEDLHWVDEQSQDLLNYLVRVTQPSRLLVLTTLRTHDRPGVATAEQLVATWSSLEGVDRIALHPLPDGEAAALVTSLTGATDDRVGKVVRLAGGSPLLIEQLAVADLDSPDGAAAVTHPMTMRLDHSGRVAVAWPSWPRSATGTWPTTCSSRPSVSRRSSRRPWTRRSTRDCSSTGPAPTSSPSRTRCSVKPPRPPSLRQSVCADTVDGQKRSPTGPATLGKPSCGWLPPSTGPSPEPRPRRSRALSLRPGSRRASARPRRRPCCSSVPGSWDRIPEASRGGGA